MDKTLQSDCEHGGMATLHLVLRLVTSANACKYLSNMESALLLKSTTEYYLMSHNVKPRPHRLDKTELL